GRSAAVREPPPARPGLWCGTNPRTVTAASAATPSGADHVSVATIVVATRIDALMLITTVSASLSPPSPDPIRRAHPHPGANRQNPTRYGSRAVSTTIGT